METKEEWIDKTMESLDGISRAESDTIFYEKLMQRIHQPGPDVFSIRSQVVWRAAALILLLISFNILTFLYFSGKSDTQGSTAKSVAKEYFSYMDSFNL